MTLDIYCIKISVSFIFPQGFGCGAFRASWVDIVGMMICLPVDLSYNV